MSGGDPAFLLRRLIDLATRERASLGAGEWEAAVELRAEYDQAFSALERSTGSTTLPAGCQNDLVRLTRLHAENVQLAMDLRQSAGSALAELTKVSQLGGYAPLGPGHQPVPRYLDHSA